MTFDPIDTPTIVLYPFRFRDQVSGRWVRARYRAERHVIARRYTEWQIAGQPEVRHVAVAGFSPWR